MINLIERLIEKEQYTDALNALTNYVKEHGADRQMKDIDSKLIKILNKQKLSNIKKRSTWDYKKASGLYEELKRQGFKSSYKINGNEMIKIVNEGSTIVNINWHFYKNILYLSGGSHLVDKYDLEERMTDYKLLKELSTYMLVNGPTEEYFYLLVGIEHMFGFNLAVKGMSSLKEIKDWVTVPFKPNLFGSEGDYLVEFKKEVRKLLEWKTGVLAPEYTAEEYCLNLNATGTSGSAFDPGGEDLKVTLFDENVKVKKNKFSKSGALSVENKLKRLFEMKAFKHKVNDKVEMYPKRRLIVSADFNSTLKMRFIDSWLGKWLSGNENSYLWRNEQQIEKMWLDFMNYDEDRWRIPLDQSAFDHHVSKEMVLIVISEIKNILDTRMWTDPKTKSEYLRVMDTIYYGLENAKVIYELRPEDDGFDINKRKFLELLWNNGVLSGWQWTSKINTICNICEGRIALNWLNNQAIKIKPIEFDATGDDQNTAWKYLSHGVLYWLFLTSNGFEIHPSKNFFSKDHNEYLRLYSTKDGINGYPARTINKILWVYPGGEEDKTVSGKLNNIYDRWNRLRQRCRQKWNKFKSLMLKDYAGGKLDKKLTEVFLYGLGINGNKQMKKENTNNESDLALKKIEYIPGTWLYHLHIHGQGFQQFNEFYGENQRSAINNWFLDACGVRDEVRGLKIKTDQEATIQDTVLIKEIPFIIVADTKTIKKPRFKTYWHSNTIFTTSSKVIEQAFGPIDLYVRNYNAPRSWIYDWLTGKVKVMYPQSDNISAAGISLIGKKFEKSLIFAMFNKRKTENKWLRLQQFYYNNIEKEVVKQIGNKMFVL